MLFGVVDHKAEDQARRVGLLRLRQSTALIGATLLFCLAAGAADAKTIYYNGNSASSTPDPQPGGQWSRDEADLSWLRPQGGNYQADDFDNNDDVIFNREDTVGGDDLIDVRIVEDIASRTILIEDGNFQFFQAAGDAFLISGQSLDIDIGASLELVVLTEIRQSGGAGIINNDGTLTLSHNALRGNVDNSGDIILNANVTLGTLGTTNTIVNANGASITAQGANRLLRLTGDFTNDGLLSGGADGSILYFVAASQTTPTIFLGENTQFANNVILQTQINNSADMDLVHVPQFYGDFTNNIDTTVTASTVVDGADYDFFNDGTLNVTGSLTGLGQVDNDGSIVVSAGATLGADSIIHNAGSLISSGTLQGAIRSGASAALRGAIDGSYTVAGGTTSVTNNLSFSTTPTGGLLDVEGGTLAINDGVTVTVASLVNDSAVNFAADLPAVPIGVIVDGDMSSSGTITGKAAITGDLTLTGTGGTFTGSELSVGGDLINDQSSLVTIGSFASIDYSRLVNSGRLNVNDLTTGPITNLADGDLRINAQVTGNVTTSGIMSLASDITGQLRIAAGTTTVTGASVVGGGAGLPLIVDAGGTLNVSGGNLTAGTVNAAGRVAIESGQTLTTTLLSVSGAGPNDNSIIEGTLAGAAEVSAGGSLLLDGGIVTGTVTNRGTITSSSTNGTGTQLQNEFVNFGTAQIGTSTQQAQVSGALRNRANATATVYGNVVAAVGGSAGVVVNAGNLTLNGNAAGEVNNSGILNMTGNMGRLVNSNQATVSGTVSGNASNTGTLTLAGTVTGSITNDGSATPGLLNVGGNLTAGSLTNIAGTVNVQGARTLTLSNGALTNGANATLNLDGRVQAASGPLNLQNQQNGTLTVRGTGTVAGNLANEGSATVAGRVTGNINNSQTGVLTLSGNGQVNGALTNTAGQLTVTSGANATVDGGTTNDGGSVNISGTLNSDVTNNGSAAVLGIAANGTIVGDLTNNIGARVVSGGTVDGNVVNDGTYVLSGVSNVTGNFENSDDGLLTQNANNSEIIVEGTFTNFGNIEAGNFVDQTLTIRAGTFRNPGSIELGEGVRVIAFIDNADTLRITSDTTLYDDLYNGEDGLVYVLADVDTDGEVNVTNDGEFTVSNGGTMTGLESVENNGIFTIARGSTVQTGSFANAAGTLTVGGVLDSDVVNSSGATAVLTGTIDGNLRNDGQARLAGDITGNLSNTANGTATVTGVLDAGEVLNAGNMVVEADAELNTTATIVNLVGGTFDADGAVNGNLQNDGQMRLDGPVTGNLTNTRNALVYNTLTGNITNSGTLTMDAIVTGNVTNSRVAELNGRITGQLINDGTRADLQITDRLVVGSVANRAGQLLVRVDKTLDVAGSLINENTGRLVIRGDVITRNGELVNRSSGGMAMAAGSTLTGNLRNDSQASLAGTVDGNVTNRGTLSAAGVITGTLTNDGAILSTSGDLRVDGLIVNQRRPLPGEPPQPDRPQLGPGDPSRFTVTAGTALTAVQGLRNDAASTVTVDGELRGNVVNAGIFDLNNRLSGSLVTSGTAQLQGMITGNVTYTGGTAALTGDLSVGGTFDARRAFNVAADRTLTVGEFINRTGDHVLTVGGTIDGRVANQGTLVALDGASLGSTVNTGTIDMTTNSSANDVLTVNGGLSGSGTYALNLDLEGNGGEGAADRVVVTGGAATGSYVLAFDSVQDVGPTDRSRRVLVFDVDESQGSANSFDFSSTGLPTASERIIYSIVQEGDYGDLYMADNINPAFGAITGNVALTQSLIGSVVNRPSSPFVPGLAVDPGEQPCGPGAWARALAGRASAEGSTTNGLNSVASTIEASYRGIQFGGDLACFDGGFRGWNVAAGVIGGINDGTTSQPVFGPSNTGVENAENTVYSINDGEFRQIYGGIYLTASRDRLSVDLQVRRERTAFKINNTPTGNQSEGLQISDSEFDSNATTVSGSVSYSYQLPREGWMVVPTAGFAFSNISTDLINFKDATLELEDSKNRVGFVGGTLSRTFIDPTKNSAFLAFGTATVYKDFADDTTSTFTLTKDGEPIRSEQLESSNLGVYGELSLGVNYLKVLDQGSARAPRQFNASIRLDGRTGDVLDSYGVTAQVRLQF